jgi:hypothetical protein
MRFLCIKFDPSCFCPLIIIAMFTGGVTTGAVYFVKYIHKHYFSCKILEIISTNCYQQNFGYTPTTFMDQYFELAGNKSGVSYGCPVNSCSDNCGFNPGNSYSCFYSGSGLYQLGLSPVGFYFCLVLILLIGIVLPVAISCVCLYFCRPKIKKVWKPENRKVIDDKEIRIDIQEKTNDDNGSNGNKQNSKVSDNRYSSYYPNYVTDYPIDSTNSEIKSVSSKTGDSTSSETDDSKNSGTDDSKNSGTDDSTNSGTGDSTNSGTGDSTSSETDDSANSETDDSVDPETNDSANLKTDDSVSSKISNSVNNNGPTKSEVDDCSKNANNANSEKNECSTPPLAVSFHSAHLCAVRETRRTVVRPPEAVQCSCETESSHSDV